MKKTVSLVLGSGGARGMVHVGIIRWLEENNYEIKSISGCSIGAMVGGFYAAGKLEEYAEWMCSLDTFAMIKLLDFKGSGGLVSGSRLFEEMKMLFGDLNIEELELKYTAVASDIENEKEIWISKGSLLDAIRASVSLPLFFTPFEYKGKKLVDGGVLNPVPIAPTFHDHTDLTIAVNLGGKVEKGLVLVKEEGVKSGMASVIGEYFSDIKLPSFISQDEGMYKVANNSFDSMQGTIARMKLATYPPDIEISVPRNLCATLEFNLSTHIIEYGYNLCERIMLEEEKKREL
jgi:NTE family protein